MWMLCGALSIFFTGITLYFTLCRKNGADWAALLDVLAPMFPVLAGYVTVQILLNALALGIRRKMRSAG